MTHLWHCHEVQLGPKLGSMGVTLGMREGESAGDGDHPGPRPLTVAIVEDHAMVAEGLASALEVDPELAVVGIAGNLAEALELVRSRRPDVVLMDYRLPDGDGASGTADVKATSPETQVVMLTAMGGQDVLARAIEAGCSGFLHKTKPISDVRMALRRAGSGEALFAPDALADVVGRLRDRGAPLGPALTARELQVLTLLAEGASTDQIAADLFLSLHTVRNHVRNILGKLGAHSKLEAVAVATREGIVNLEDRP